MYIAGEAALHILREEFGDNWNEKVKVIFAGDDTTDEDAMKVTESKMTIPNDISNSNL